jgi:hypothetical protein
MLSGLLIGPVPSSLAKVELPPVTLTRSFSFNVRAPIRRFSFVLLDMNFSLLQALSPNTLG